MDPSGSSRYVAPALVGHEVVIAKAGRPSVRLVSLESPAQGRRGGFLRVTALIEADLKGKFAAEIGAMFD